MRPPIFAALLLGTFAACPSPPTKTCVTPRGGAGGGGGTSALAGPIGLTGQAMGVELDLSVPVDCNGTSAAVTSIDVSVLDPTNQPVTASASTPVLINGQPTTTITFTPATPGSYHLTVRAEPGLGTAQKDVLVALDKTGEQPVIVGVPVSPAPLNCLQIDFDGATLLCLDLDSSTNATWLRTVRAAVVVDSVRANAFALSSGRVWTHSDVDQNLHLYSLGPSGSLTHLASLSINLNGLPQILPQADRAIVIDMNSFVEVQYSADAGFSVSTDIGVAPTNVGNGSGGQWVPDLGVIAVPGGNQVCSYSASGGQFLDAGCTSAGVTVLGFDDDGVWWVDPTQGSDTVPLTVTGWRSGQPAPVIGSIELSSNFGLRNSSGQWTPQASPILVLGSGELYVPQFDGHEVSLARYPPDGLGVHADSQRVWFQSNDTITWYPR